MKFTGNVAASFLALTSVSYSRASAAEPVETQDTQKTTASQKTAQKISVPVFYITNRVVKPDKEPEYTIGRSEKLSYGVRNMDCSKVGDKISVDKYVNTEMFSDESDFLSELTNAQRLKGNKPVIVYVHGYACNIEVASRVAAKMGAEMKLPVVMFSWPSRRNFLTYAADECNAEWSSFQLTDILQDLGKKIGNDNIILVGHSMGCRMICWAVQRVSANEPLQNKFRHVFLCSPDIDEGIFKKYAAVLNNCSDDTRVFASHKDARLRISKALHGGMLRLGSLAPALRAVAPGKKVADGAGGAGGAGGDAVAANRRTVATDGFIQTIDYTEDDPTVFGHAIPYKLMYEAVDMPNQKTATHKTSVQQ